MDVSSPRCNADVLSVAGNRKRHTGLEMWTGLFNFQSGNVPRFGPGRQNASMDVSTDVLSNRTGRSLYFFRFRRAALEISWGTGNMIGSALGGKMIDIWAYPLPFFVMSAILMLSFPWNTKLALKINSMPSPIDQKVESVKPKYSNLMRDPLYLAHMVTLTTVWVISAFNEPTLQPSLEEFQTSVTVRGTVFAVQFASYVFGCALAATFCHLQVTALYAFLGHLLTLTGYLIIGPVILIQLERNLGLVYASQVLLGVGMSSLFVCAYHQALRRATEMYYPDDITTHGFVSSTVFTFMVSGSIVTDPIAGKANGHLRLQEGHDFHVFPATHVDSCDIRRVGLHIEVSL
ncbi:uncharacterized protein LOC119460616 isoform X2 [Dermacentor silvarum]|uniref:uncharacterized protein LOC119460616 isoform X2 n=1 Tax=Dermacentor silvarum TaxID=543639 RepID=UPI00210155A8|nr:uncharacterized protein LOC119460616 isoform X2 [Dermacentor silvarum]